MDIIRMMTEIEEMSHPMMCMRCREVHDAGKVTVVQRYADCSMWRCPHCKAMIDDRAQPIGSAVPVTQGEVIGVDWNGSPLIAGTPSRW